MVFVRMVRFFGNREYYWFVVIIRYRIYMVFYGFMGKIVRIGYGWGYVVSYGSTWGKVNF